MTQKNVEPIDDRVNVYVNVCIQYYMDLCMYVCMYVYVCATHHRERMLQCGTFRCSMLNIKGYVFTVVHMIVTTE